MSVVSIINRNFFKTPISARCLSWYTNYVQAPSDQPVNRQQICLTKKLSAVTSSNNFQCRFKYNKSSNSKKDENEEVGTLNANENSNILMIMLHLQDDDSTDKDFYDTADTKLVTVRVTSLRMDLIVKSALGMARK